MSIEAGNPKDWIEDYQDVGAEFGAVVKRMHDETESNCKKISEQMEANSNEQDQCKAQRRPCKSG